MDISTHLNPSQQISTHLNPSQPNFNPSQPNFNSFLLPHLMYGDVGDPRLVVDFLVTPTRLPIANLHRQVVVVPKPQDSEREQKGILVPARISDSYARERENALS